MNSSWFDMSDSDEIIEKEILINNTHSNIAESCKNNDNISQLSLNEILNIKYNELSESNLLKYQTYVSFQLKKHVTLCKTINDYFDTDTYLCNLEWLLETSKYLAKNKGLKIISHKNMGHIKRNSYEFCENGNACVNNKLGKCKKKHFVYNYVCADIEDIIKYLKNNTHSSAIKKDIYMNELYTTLNTINYVFNHMYDEMAHLNKHYGLQPNISRKIIFK
jgi:hypothetical protein